ncbi:Mitochondrial substrate/solute carrier [Penicillium atrosanguineum]|uniref:Uncharacterized protein n=1 Tax=Penicillium atrosanguineum TaxID=1132637 RepID=A0A9W9PQ95_9EURO|nr:Mitochondrial substrate/solute carrier [Penicillium atrosanguineum]KAJ5125186.1 hypothetical protein N7526_007363 [Penicillium atrosanguineum]KAJ5292312.1 Mitochondrial substrate/solute carrier [Penicillium atrosanguineum]KAJ5303669.1 hypothetical protein N7476_010468 [Penicillium atrosanguineum]
MTIPHSRGKWECVLVDDIVRSAPYMLCFSLEEISLVPIGEDPWNYQEYGLHGANGYNGGKLKNGLEQKSEKLG